MKTLAILLTMLALSCHAQTTPVSPTIKCHILGESLQQFVNNSNATTKDRVDSCLPNSTKPVMCGSIAESLAKPDTDSFALCYDTELDKLEKSSWCAEFNGMVQFEHGKLVDFQVNIWDSWNGAYGSLLQKFGKPTVTRSHVLENGFGATFHTTSGLWVSKSYRVNATEQFDEQSNRYVLLEMMTTA